MPDDFGFSLRVPADLGVAYAMAFALGLVGLLTGAVLVASGFGTVGGTVPVLALLAVVVLVFGVALYTTDD